jgi:iron transport multicopper oxidase
MVLNIGVDFSIPAFLINGNSYYSPPVPVLLQILNGTDPHQLMPQGSVIPLPGNSLIELTIPGGSILSPVNTILLS